MKRIQGPWGVVARLGQQDMDDLSRIANLLGRSWKEILSEIWEIGHYNGLVLREDDREIFRGIKQKIDLKSFRKLTLK